MVNTPASRMNARHLCFLQNWLAEQCSFILRRMALFVLRRSATKMTIKKAVWLMKLERAHFFARMTNLYETAVYPVKT